MESESYIFEWSWKWSWSRFFRIAGVGAGCQSCFFKCSRVEVGSRSRESKSGIEVGFAEVLDSELEPEIILLTPQPWLYLSVGIWIT